MLFLHNESHASQDHAQYKCRLLSCSSPCSNSSPPITVTFPCRNPPFNLNINHSTMQSPLSSGDRKLIVAQASTKLWRGGDAVLKYLCHLNPQGSDVTTRQILGFFPKFIQFARDIAQVTSTSRASSILMHRANVFESKLGRVETPIDARHASIAGARFKSAMLETIEHHRDELLDLGEDELVRRISRASRHSSISTMILSIVNNRTHTARLWWAFRKSPHPVTRVLFGGKSLTKMWALHNDTVRLCAVALTHRADLNYHSLPDRVVTQSSTPSWATQSLSAASPSRTRSVNPSIEQVIHELTT